MSLSYSLSAGSLFNRHGFLSALITAPCTWLRPRNRLIRNPANFSLLCFCFLFFTLLLTWKRKTLSFCGLSTDGLRWPGGGDRRASVFERVHIYIYVLVLFWVLMTVGICPLSVDR